MRMIVCPAAVVASMMLAACAPRDSLAGRGLPDSDLKRLVDDIARYDSGEQSVSVENAVVRVKTDAVDRVVAQGPRIVPHLIRRMEETEDFDTFARCYSACQQIFSGSRIHWMGGATVETVEGVMRVRPAPSLDFPAFKKSVIESVRAVSKGRKGS